MQIYILLTDYSIQYTTDIMLVGHHPTCYSTYQHVLIAKCVNFLFVNW